MIDRVAELHKKNRKTFKDIKTIFCALLLIWKLYYVTLEPILKRSLEEEVRELQYGSAAL